MRRSRRYGNSDEHVPHIHDTIPRSSRGEFQLYDRTPIPQPRDHINHIIYHQNERPALAPLEIYYPPYQGIPQSPTSPSHNLHHQRSGATRSQEWPALPPPAYQSPHQSPPLHKLISYSPRLHSMPVGPLMLPHHRCHHNYTYTLNSTFKLNVNQKTVAFRIIAKPILDLLWREATGRSN